MNGPEISVEKIMDEIRAQICREEGMAEIPAFDEVPNGDGVPAGAERECDWPLLMTSLKYVNQNYEIPYYWDLGPKSVKTFVKRVVRKLIRCMLLPVLTMLNAFNANVVRCLNQLRYHVEVLCARDEACRKELESLRQQVIRLEEAQRIQGESLEAQARQITEQRELLETQTRQAAEQQRLLETQIQQLSEQQGLLEAQTQQIAEQRELLETQTQQMLDTAADNAKALDVIQSQTSRWCGDQTVKMQAMARDIVRTKWTLKDYLDGRGSSQESIVKCGICGHEERASNLEKKTTHCIFDGGQIVRYVCPECGAVFGPTKLSALSRQEFDDDYTVHYTGYHEGDSTEKEIRTFMRLEPVREGIYLNYGCGSWSHTMQKLHEQGYQVYGYEPYSRDIDNPYIISDRNVLSKMRFHGIFSNDVLEHFMDPVAELRFMKSLLAAPDARMAHSTGCYDYKYEYTRFHMFFFTGRALDVICEKAGLNLLEISDAESSVGEKDFHCRTFEMLEEEIDYLPMAYLNDLAQKDGAEISLAPGGFCCGPYITMPPGTYTLDIVIDAGKNMSSAGLEITALSGRKKISEAKLRTGENLIPFSLDCMEKELEFVIRNHGEENVTLKRLALRR